LRTPVHAWSVLPPVGLRHPTDREDAVFVGAKHDPLEGANVLEVALFRSLEDFLAELADKGIGTGPVDTVPVTRPLHRWAYGYLFALILHHTLPKKTLNRSPVRSQHPFGSGHQALSSRLSFPVVFRLLAFASSDLPYPLGNSAVLASGLPLLPGGPHRAYHVEQEGDTSGLGAFFVARARGVLPPVLCQSREPTLPGPTRFPLAGISLGNFTRRFWRLPRFMKFPLTQLRAKVHSRSPYRTFPSPVRPCGRLVIRHCPRSFTSPLLPEAHVRVGISLNTSLS